MSHQETQPGDLPGVRVTRVIDMKLPLTWLLTVAATIVGGGFGLYYKLDRLGEDVTDMKIAVKTGNQATATVQGEIAILRFRVENLESDKRVGGGR